MPAALAVSSIVGSRPSSCSSFLETLRSLRHRLDHVDRDADGAGLVGDGPGDRLANPPGGVGARTCSRGGTRTCRPPASGRCCLPGSGRGSSGRGCGTSWRCDTTSRRLPPDRSRLASSYSAKRFFTISTRLRRPAGSSSVISIRSRSSFSRLARSSLAARWPFSSSICFSSSSMRDGDLLQLLHQRLDLLGADATVPRPA